MTAPGLGNRGRALWRSIVKGLPEAWEFDEREGAILAMACRQADDLARLETAIKKGGVMVPGSAGQPVLNPAVAEARQGRLAVNRLLGQLALPDEGEEPRTAAGERGRRAAESRWGRVAELGGRRGA
jgi:phage terminase small subunit